MNKNYLLATALAIMTMASCSDNDFVGDQEALKAGSEGAISFGFDVPTTTRASGATAATALGNQFIVYGEKGSITNVAPTAGNLVFPNYQVNYVASSANTTTSNTKNWEYVGYTHSTAYQNNITRDPSSTADDEIKASDAVQTIKYWDYAAANYIFTAVSAKTEDIADGRVKIQKNEYGTGNYDKGYTITLAKSGSEPYTYPSLSNLYFSDREVIAQSTAGSNRDAVNAYGGNVTLTFRNLVSQIRAGIYETIPGYDVKEIKFYISDGDDGDSNPDLTIDHAFGAICPNTKVSNYEGTITVVYYTNSDGDLENQPKVTVSGSPATDLILGNNFNNISTSALLSKSSAEPTWDKSDKSFTEVLPQITNSTNLKLTVDYTLWNSVTGETIEVKGATAEIPSQYLQWKPNYKYTYLFKISNNTNGWTNPTLGPAGLWPITFDAIEIVAEDGNVEYITTVSEPSITSYAKASAVTTDDEYLTGNNIYVVVEDGSTNASLEVNTNAKLYTATIEAGAAQELTEASVANALANGAGGYDGGTILTKGTLLDGYYTESAGLYTACTASTYADGTTTYYKSATKVVTDALGKKLAVFDVSSGLTAVTSIAAADSYTGAAISVNGAKFSPAAATYTKQTVTVGTTVVTGWYTRSGEGTTESPYVYTLITAADTKAASGTDYYAKATSAAGFYVFEYYKAAVGDPCVAATGTYASGTTYYTDNTGASTVDTTGFTVGVTDVSSYFVANPSYKPAVKIYKVIKVVDQY
jgi:hypothetical protein